MEVFIRLKAALRLLFRQLDYCAFFGKDLRSSKKLLSLQVVACIVETHGSLEWRFVARWLDIAVLRLPRELLLIRLL